MNIYLKAPPFAPVLGLFAAKCGAFSTKMECVLVLNTVCFGAKCSVFWCKMQCVLVQNAVQNAAKWKAKRHKNTLQLYKQNLFKA